MGISKRSIFYSGATLVALGNVILAEHAFAAEASDTSAGNASDQVIIVTAQKREERLSDVPLSITAQTAEQLNSKGVVTVADLEKVVTGFAYQQNYFGNPIYYLRGMGFYDSSVGVSPTVSVYIDQVPLAYSAMTRGVGLDLERVEVLKGPQGTLFGQNATGGAINYIAAKPTDTLHFGARLDYGRFNAANLEGYISGPLAEGVNARVAVRSERSDDWQRSQTRPTDTNGRRNFRSARALLDITPSDSLKIELSANGWMDKSENPAAQYLAFFPQRPTATVPAPFQIPIVQPVAPRKSRVADWTPGQNFARDDWFYQLAARADLNVADNVTMTSITAYSRYKSSSPVDADGTILIDFTGISDARIRSFSQELRLAGDVGPVKWLIGGNYANDHTFDQNTIGNRDATTAQFGPVIFSSFYYNNIQDAKTKAVFGSLDFALSDQLTVQGSMRYTDQKRDFSGCLYDSGDGGLAAAVAFVTQIFAGQTVTYPAGSCLTVRSDAFPHGPVLKNLNEDNLSWRGNISWKPNSDTLVYANITKGFKAGTFPTIAASVDSQYIPAVQESVLAYEAGFKLSMADRRIQLDGAVFYSDYKNKQLLGRARTIFGPNASLINIPKSRVSGAELTATVRPVTGLTLTLGGTYIDSKINRDFVTDDPFATSVNLKGESFPMTPRWQLTADIDYSFPLNSNVSGYLGANGRYRSSTFSNFGERPELKIDGYGVLDLRAGIADADGRWKVGVWGRNVTNTFYEFQITKLIDVVARIPGTPASYGISASFAY